MTRRTRSAAGSAPKHGVRRPTDLAAAALDARDRAVHRALRRRPRASPAPRCRAPRRVRATTRYGSVPVLVHGELGRPAYVHLHGGAWLMRYPQMDDFWCRYVAAEAGVTVVNVDFRAAPYVAYPVAQHEAHDAAAWVAGHGAPSRSVASPRAAGSRRRVPPGPRLGLVHPGAPGPRRAGARRGLRGPRSATGMISPSFRDLVRRVYFPDPASRAEPYASPVLAPDLTGLPPAVVMTAERDTLRPDGLRYVERLREAGVEVVHDETPGADHYFLTHDLARARRTMAMVTAEIARRLAT